MAKKTLSEKLESKRYHPGRVLGLFDSMIGDAFVHGTPQQCAMLSVISDLFYMGVRRIVGSGDIAPVRVKPGRVARDPYQRSLRIHEYLEALEQKYRAHHEEGAAEGRKTARHALDSLCKTMRWQAQEKKPRGSKTMKSSDLPSPSSIE